MRCKTCNIILTDEEATFKAPDKDTYQDECMDCYGNGVNDLAELMPEESITGYEDYD